MTLAECAVAIGRSYHWTARNWRRLAVEDGFPLPYLGEGRGERPIWHEGAVRAWMARERSATPCRRAKPGPQDVSGARNPLDPANDLGRGAALAALAGD